MCLSASPPGPIWFDLWGHVCYSSCCHEGNLQHKVEHAKDMMVIRITVCPQTQLISKAHGKTKGRLSQIVYYQPFSLIHSGVFYLWVDFFLPPPLISRLLSLSRHTQSSVSGPASSLISYLYLAWFLSQLPKISTHLIYFCVCVCVFISLLKLNPRDPTGNPIPIHYTLHETSDIETPRCIYPVIGQTI